MWDAFTQALGGSAAGAVVGELFGPSDGHVARETRRANTRTRQNVRLGNNLDLRNQKAMFDFRLGRARDAGLTSVEMFGSPAAGAGGGTTGSGNTLGNANNQQDLANKAREQEMRLAWQTETAKNATALAQTKMQTDTQKEVAGVQAGVTQRGQDIDQDIANKKLALSRDQLQLQRDLAAAQIGLTKAQTDKTVNEVATSSEKFVTAMKQLSMGPTNLLVELTMRHHGIKLSDESFTSLQPAKRRQIIDEIIALSSNTFIEAKGAGTLGGDAAKGAEGFIDQVMKILRNPIGLHKGIEATPAPKPSLGNTMSGPYSGGPDMNYR